MMCSAFTCLTFLVVLAGASSHSFVSAADESQSGDLTPLVANPEPPEPELPKYTQGRVRKLVSQLSSDRFSVRRSATEKLIAIGPAAVEQLAQAIRTGETEVQLRAFKCLEAFFGSRNFAAVPQTWAILEDFTEDSDSLVAERSRDLLSRYGQVRGQLAVERIKSMQGIVLTTLPNQTMVGIDSNWTGGDKGLQFLKILREKGMPPRCTVYLIEGAPVSKQAVAELEKSLADANILVQPRGRASLGIAGGINFRARRGCEVRDVQRGKAAANAGIRPGDVITRFGSIEVEDFQHLVDLIRKYDVEDQVDVELETGEVKKVTLSSWMSVILPPDKLPQNMRRLPNGQPPNRR